MSMEVFMDGDYGANGFWHPVFGLPFINLPTLWRNSVNQLSEDPQISMDEVAFFAFRLDETFLHEILHGKHGLTDPQVNRILEWLNEILLYE